MAISIAVEKGPTNAYAQEDRDSKCIISEISLGMGTIHRIIAVIYAYNEEVAIGSLVLGVLPYVDQVIVVDDCSHDCTSKIAELAGAKVISISQNMGKVKSLLTGLSEVEPSNCLVAIMLDGDGHYCADDFEKVVTPIINGEADLVIGSRSFCSPKDISRYQIIRQKVSNSFQRLGSKVKLNDSQLGLMALSSNTLKNLNFSSEDNNIESDKITRFIEEELVIKEASLSAYGGHPNSHQESAKKEGKDVMSNELSTFGFKRPLLHLGFQGWIIYKKTVKLTSW